MSTGKTTQKSKKIKIKIKITCIFVFSMKAKQNYLINILAIVNGCNNDIHVSLSG
jgi:hypothetical protein